MAHGALNYYSDLDLASALDPLNRQLESQIRLVVVIRLIIDFFGQCRRQILLQFTRRQPRRQQRFRRVGSMKIGVARYDSVQIVFGRVQ